MDSATDVRCFLNPEINGDDVSGGLPLSARHRYHSHHLAPGMDGDGFSDGEVQSESVDRDCRRRGRFNNQDLEIVRQNQGVTDCLWTSHLIDTMQLILPATRHIYEDKHPSCDMFRAPWFRVQRVRTVH